VLSLKKTFISSAICSPASSCRKCEALASLTVLCFEKTRSKRMRSASRKAKSFIPQTINVCEFRQVLFDRPEIGRGSD
jgi:hypothetical protein